MQPQTIVLATTGVLATLGLGYLVYFDYKRRNDPDFRRRLRRERKLAAKEAKAATEESKQTKAKLIETVLQTAASEQYPTSPEEKEKYFMSNVAAGEEWCGKGEAFYDDAILPFYKALKVYPAPMELVMIYQKTLPPPVFETITQIMELEHQAGAGSAADVE
ncbi:mitochondrial outer membrane translocase complex, subunit Tom20 domain-containing protein [Radiomyces spectabilis]|uniref:mitochondrial outer membrane translocase complex, subunit Tom20 domain-containing protein n=1 Tax=Radiomyces spectabilis TaxID=64574 RepID=UPI00221FA19C|nr:mitochondrial outer membrane translocase complex, subunit Tom20 domain-containing protein [Radiomyces spectabilis]KAI8376115.1 mitochondrial outer membrane translocase complex, subunit Tom20 domain-containing protein [Radiomyces spectabilis]